MGKISIVEEGVKEAIDFVANNEKLISACKNSFMQIEDAKSRIIENSNTFFKKIKVNILVVNILKDTTTRGIASAQIMNPQMRDSSKFDFIKLLAIDNFTKSSLNNSNYPKMVPLKAAGDDLSESLAEYSFLSSTLIGLHNELISGNKNIYTLICLSSFEKNSEVDTLNYATKFLKKIDNDPYLRGVFDLDKGSIFRLQECLERSLSKEEYSELVEKKEYLTTIVSDMEECEDSENIGNTYSMK